MVGYKLDFTVPQEQKGWSDSELGRRLNVSRSTVAYLKIRNSIDFDTLAKLCNVLEVEPQEILKRYEIK